MKKLDSILQSLFDANPALQPKCEYVHFVNEQGQFAKFTTFSGDSYLLKYTFEADEFPIFDNEARITKALTQNS